MCICGVSQMTDNLLGQQGDRCEYPACEREVMACRHCMQKLCKIHHDWGLWS